MDIYTCSFCGEKLSGSSKTCLTCKTKPQRRLKIIEQLEIEKENEKKGYKISDKLFMFNRGALLKLYNLNS